jgi:chromosome segregation ATPase
VHDPVTSIVATASAIISAALGVIVALLRAAYESHKEENNRRLAELTKDLDEQKVEIRGLNERTHAQEKKSIWQDAQIERLTAENKDLRKQTEWQRTEIESLVRTAARLDHAQAQSDIRSTGPHRPAQTPGSYGRAQMRSRPDDDMTSTNPPRKT